MKRSSASFPAHDYIAPRYWLTWLGLATMRLGTLLPYRLQLWLGAVIGNTGYYLLSRRRHIARVNIALCYPHLNRRRQRQLIKKVFHSVGMALFETGLAWWGSDKRLAALAHIEGVEHIIQAQQQGRGVLLLGGHFTTVDLCGRLLARHLSYYTMAKKAHNPLFEAVMSHRRATYYAGIIERKDLRSMLTILHQGKACWYAPDQDLGRKGSVFVPFMGIPAVTLTSTARLARSTNAAVIPVQLMRLPGTQGYSISILPALANYPTGDELEDARRVNAHIENNIAKVPDQYLWIHRRFKTRPDGHDPYQPGQG